MKKTVRELIEMIKNGTLKTEQSTQRSMIYSSITVRDGGEQDDGHIITKSGAVIYSILQHGIKLPALYMWKNGEDDYDLIDGKQRLLSLYYFLEKKDIEGNPSIFTTIHEGELKTLDGLPEEEIEKLYNYEFDIVVNEGNQELKEVTFDRINKFAENLNIYERVRGLVYGKFIEGFEEHIKEIASKKDKVLDPSFGRGKHLFYYLSMYFGLYDRTDGQVARFDEDRAYFIMRSLFRKQRPGTTILLRNAEYTKSEDFEDVMDYLDKFLKIGLDINKSFLLISEIRRRDWNIRVIYDYFSNGVSGENAHRNDIKSWSIDTILLASKSIVSGTSLDYKRFFTDSDKSTLFRNNDGRSSMSQEKHNYRKLQVDHIIPWSAGGRTELDNAQLLTASENASKRDRYDL